MVLHVLGGVRPPPHDAACITKKFATFSPFPSCHETFTRVARKNSRVPKKFGRFSWLFQVVLHYTFLAFGVKKSWNLPNLVSRRKGRRIGKDASRKGRVAQSHRVTPTSIFLHDPRGMGAWPGTRFTLSGPEWPRKSGPEWPRKSGLEWPGATLGHTLGPSICSDSGHGWRTLALALGRRSETLRLWLAQPEHDGHESSRESE